MAGFLRVVVKQLIEQDRIQERSMGVDAASLSRFLVQFRQARVCNVAKCERLMCSLGCVRG